MFYIHLRPDILLLSYETLHDDKYFYRFRSVFSTLFIIKNNIHRGNNSSYLMCVCIISLRDALLDDQKGKERVAIYREKSVILTRANNDLGGKKKTVNSVLFSPPNQKTI